MRISHFIIYVGFLVLMTGCTGSANPDDTVTDGSNQAGFAQIMNKADSLYNSMQFRDAYGLYLQLLNNNEVEDDSLKKLSVLNALSTSSELAGHKAEEAKWLKQLLDLATQTGNDYYHSLALIDMGQNVFYEGDREQGIQYVSDAVGLMAKTNRDDTDHLMHGCLIMLARLYGEVKDDANALKTDERNLKLTMEGTRWGSAPNQQLIDRRMALAKMAAVLAKMGNFQRADSAYAAWKAVQYEGNHTRDYFIVDYLKRRGYNQEALSIYNKLIQRVREQGDTLGEMMNTVKWGMAEVYRKMGLCQQAADLYEDVLEIQDTLKSRRAKNTALELAAIYREKEQDQIIMRQEAVNTRNRYLLFSVIGVLLGVTTLTVIVIHKNRGIKRRNRALAQQIAEKVNYGKKYWEEKRAQTQKPATAPDDLDAFTDEQLFQRIHEIVVQDRLYLDPSFERQTIMDRFQLSKERVGTIFSKGSGHAKLSSYIQQLRLDYAAQLLADDPECSITQIATDCGFGSSAYFSSCFRQHFGFSPTDFRRNTSAVDE
ncbi:MAG: helix-turn-helix transcriptional regulator [Bacteroidaceae bacterium]|nr:helix-turn-helix transcriptional regulator [Bacteroidaceae bacterium]